MSSLLHAITSIHKIIKLSERSRGASDFIFQSKKIKTFVDCDIKNKKNKKGQIIESIDEKKINYDLFQDVVRVYVHLLCVVGVKATQSLGDLHLVDKAEQSRKKDAGEIRLDYIRGDSVSFSLGVFNLSIRKKDTDFHFTFHYFCFQ